MNFAEVSVAKWLPASLDRNRLSKVRRDRVRLDAARLDKTKHGRIRRRKTRQGNRLLRSFPQHGQTGQDYA
jgi:hypothetical protein